MVVAVVPLFLLSEFAASAAGGGAFAAADAFDASAPVVELSAFAALLAPHDSGSCDAFLSAIGEFSPLLRHASCVKRESSHQKRTVLSSTWKKADCRTVKDE